MRSENEEQMDDELGNSDLVLCTRNGCGVAACDQWTSRRVHLLVRCFFNSIFLVGHLDVSLAGIIFA